jgi:CheY-like chemotaxis protein
MSDAPSARSPTSPSGKWVVLVADPSADMRQKLCAAIKAYDASAEIIEARTGHEALAVLIERSPDVALVNVQLPDITGAEAVAWAGRRGVRPVTILMSPLVLPKWVEISTELHAYEFWRQRPDVEHVRQLLEGCRAIRRPMKLLLVDPSPSSRAAIRRALSQCSFTLDIEEASSGNHALKRLRERHYDLALIDANFSGGVSGFVTAFHARVASPNTKLILMSNRFTPAAAQAANRFGLRSFLTKPFGARDLELALHADFGLRRPYLLHAVTAPSARPRPTGGRP